VLLCYLVPLLLAGNIVKESGAAARGSVLLWGTLEWLMLVVGGLSIALLLAGLSLRFGSRSTDCLHACPPMVWAVGFGCLLPVHLRNLGLLAALALVQWPRLTSAMKDIRASHATTPLRLIHLGSALLMSMALAIGELNTLAYQPNQMTSPTLLGDIVFSTSLPDVRVAIVILLGLSLVFAVTSRLIQRIFPAVSDSA
jgi:hypothetical protein